MNFKKEVFKEQKYKIILTFVELGLKKCNGERVGELLNMEGSGTTWQEWNKHHIISEFNSLMDGMDETIDEKDFELIDGIVNMFNDTIPNYEDKLLKIRGIVKDRLKWFS